MAERLRVNPTRMELSRLKKRLKVAVRGHKLLKDKRDELMKKFVELVKQNKEMREQVEKELTQALGDFLVARAVMSSELLEAAIMYPTTLPNIETSVKNIMSVDVPMIQNKQRTQDEQGGSIHPYGFADTSAELDGAITTLNGVLDKMIKLAEVEKTCQLLADEIEKTRRRVNALEHVMIPQLEETIRFITMKLDENERSNLTRLMKVKDMIQDKNA
ncbi:MAG: V-type ATP synthase subunit D [Clostridia bacterium]|nr:V-type ATP synthase subunit D [Clostridia bacterium]